MPQQAPAHADPAPALGVGRALPHPDRDEIRLAAVLHALSDPTRLHIAHTLARLGEAACSVIDLAVSKSTTTHHYRVLREAGVISQVYRGTSKLNALRRDDLEARFPGLLDSVLAAAEREGTRG
ncbi:helix-turn-helix transcriptional regulator [Micromonospora sonneratiae]|uniref:ArsR/SmtB family transcription factor n=1 Tax=Micromonospora sonneratiae TaxID=1184706 RepID=A0ABW3YJ74_9ACTN